MDAQFVLTGHRKDIIALSESAIWINQELGHQK